MWWFSAVSAQILGERLKKERLSWVPKEMVTGKHSKREGHTRLITPGFEIASTHPMILQAAKSRDGTIEGRPSRVHVSLVNGQICPQDGKHDLHEFRLFQHFVGNAIQSTQFEQEFFLGQGMDRLVSKTELRRAIRRNKQANGLDTGLSPELTSEFKGNQSSQAVTIEGKPRVQKWNQGLGENLNEWCKPGERSLPQASASAGELHRADLNIRWQAGRPGTKNRGGASCVWEAEETEPGLCVRFSENKPRTRSRCRGH
jgi:hypothetical protein